jgi:mannose/fructose/N-acetylgalactosamine-specific phosphotransferase system component IIC
MSRITVALLVGGALGVLDGLTAWFTPEVRSQLMGIVIGSTVKGLIAGALIGLFARKSTRILPAVVFGTAVGAVLAFGIALLQGSHYLEIVLPGTLVGLLTGYATMRYGRPATAAPAAIR